MTVENKIAVHVCNGTGGMVAGGGEVLQAFKDAFAESGVKAEIGDRCSVNGVGCRGLCAREVLVDITVGDEVTTYQYIQPDMVSRLVEEHIIGGTPVEEFMVGKDYHEFLSRQKKIVLADCGRIDPEEIDAYLDVGGYSVVKKTLKTMSPDEVIQLVKKSGLRGRGGAGFPTGVKWELCAKNKADQRYIICNSDEGDPGAVPTLIEGNPHSVIEGMTIGAYAIGADMGFVYIRTEYPLAVERLKKAIDHARERGFLGQSIHGSTFDFDIRIKLGAGAFVCGEETALISSIVGERGMPRAKPPFPADEGLWGKPTIINNTETFANLPHILRNGPEWYSSIGTETSKGTKIIALTGKVRNSGLIEVPMGTTIREIVFDIGGGIPDGKLFKAVQTGGPCGGCVPQEHLDLPVDYENLARVGSMMGSGSMVVLDETDCMVNMAAFFLAFNQAESCGKCPPCRIGTKRLFEILTGIMEGRGRKGDIELLLDLSADIMDSSLCGLGMVAPNPVVSTIRYFRHEYEAHIRHKRCPAKVCRSLLTYFIRADLCRGCGVCAKGCPVGAITGIKKEPHRIDTSACVKCGACYDTCKFNAVLKE